MKTFLFITICVLSVSADSDIICTDNFFGDLVNKIHLKSPFTLFLISSADKEINRNFTKIASFLGFRVVEQTYHCSDLYASELAAKTIKNVVNLNVKLSPDDDLGDYDSLMRVGYSRDGPIKCNDNKIGDPNPCREICKSNSKNKTLTKDRVKYETCESTFERINYIDTYVTLISKSLRKYKPLIDILSDFDGSYKMDSNPLWSKYAQISKKSDKPLVKHSVLVCIDRQMKDTDEQMNEDFDSVRYIKDCENINDFPTTTVIAAVAPKPFKEEEITYIPTIFYNIPYLLSEHKYAYNNSIILYDNYFDKLKRALMKFIELQEWNRIAIVSDDSPYSADFEAELTDLFIEEGVVYVAKQICQEHCSDTTCKSVCKFNKIINSLKDDQAKIIIANVDEKHAKDLVKAAAKEGLTASSGVMWIWRDWPFQSDFDVEDLKDVYSIYLGPETEKLQSLPHYANIYESISSIMEIKDSNQIPVSKSKKSLIHLHEENPLQFFRVFTAEIRQILESRPFVMVHLRKISKAMAPEIVYSFKVNSKEVKVTRASPIPFKDLDDCSNRSYSFDSPCEDIYPLILLLVIFCFMLVVLAIVLFFKKIVNRWPHYSSLR